MEHKTKQPEFITNFIELYRQEICLWKVKHESYSNKLQREQAYSRLLDFYKTVDPNANIETVKQKINNLRSAFRNELKKIKRNTKSGAGQDFAYLPSLWYFDQLPFIKDQEEAREGLSSSEVVIDNDNTLNDFEEYNTSYCQAISDDGVSTPSPSPSTSSSSSKKRSYQTKQKEKDIIHEAYKELTKPQDEYDIVGANVAFKLGAMDIQQRHLAENLINFTLFYGACRKLTENAHISLVDDHPQFINALPVAIQNSQHSSCHLPNRMHDVQTIRFSSHDNQYYISPMEPIQSEKNDVDLSEFLQPNSIIQPK